MNNGFHSGSFKTAIFADCLANSKEIFQLIERVFPIDSCRHYEVLPLKLEGSNLILGMLNPEKEESLKFIRSIAKVFKYDLEIQLIDLQTFQIILSSYPQNKTRVDRQPQDRNQTVLDENFSPNAANPGINPRRNIDAAPTIISNSESFASDEPLSDLPADLGFLKDLELAPHTTEMPPQVKPDSTATLFEIPAEFMNQKPSGNLDDKATMISENSADLLAQSPSQKESEMAFNETEAKISQLIAETLGKLPQEVQEVIESESNDFLPPILSQLSWTKLLEKAFQHQTDYLQLVRYSDRGSVVASKDKINQSSLNSIPLPLFCSLIDEIKRMARLPQNSSNHSKKIVLERFHQQERILLRLEFSVQQNLEEVSVKVLRNRALENYEQQQMNRVSDRALQLAKELEKTLRKIQACFDSAELNNIKELQTIHSRITHQLRLLDK